MTMEAEHTKRERNRKLQTLILGSVAIAGALAVALVAPNVLGAMGKLGLMPRPRQDEYINAARKRLKKQGFLVERDGFLHITGKGKEQLQSSVLSLGQLRRPKRWDKKWRVLIFDIPERRRGVRIALRRQLIAAGFMRMQDSVWIYPHPCEEFVALLKSDLRIGTDMLYLIVDALEGDAKFRSAFGLPVSHGESVKLPQAVEVLLDPILPRKR